MSARGTSGGAILIRIGGAAGLVGGFVWVVKGVVILAGGDQPPLTFDLALPLFGACLLGVALLTMPTSHRRTVVVTLAWVALVSGMVAWGSEVLGRSWDASIATCGLALLVGQVCLLKIRPAPAPLTFWLGAGTVPALSLGGVLAEHDERLLEIPLVVIALVWMLVGWVTLRRQAE